MGNVAASAPFRPITDTTAQNRVRDLVLEAYAEYEASAAANAVASSVWALTASVRFFS